MPETKNTGYEYPNMQLS